MATELIPVNSYIIPMESQFQDDLVNNTTGMYKAYGLVYQLLLNEIPVKWAIQPGKAYDGTDFTASAQDVQTAAIVNNHNYIGGPFIIDAAFQAQALPIIQGWQNIYPEVAVHQATASFSAPIAATMSRAPRIAVDEDNAGISTDYLNEAAIPDSNGDPWTDKPEDTPDVLPIEDIRDGAFFGGVTAAQDPCRRRSYDVFLVPHTGGGDWLKAENVPAISELNTYLEQGGVLWAACAGIEAMENIVGTLFLTTSGIPNDQNKGDDGTFTVDVPDFPSAQATSNNEVQGLPGGSISTWRHDLTTYRPTTQVLAYFLDNGDQYDFMVAGAYRGGTGAGKIVYEGGHEYSNLDEAYINTEDGPYFRFVLDTLFLGIAKPEVDLQVSPATIPQGSPSVLNFSIDNIGGSVANTTGFSLTLAAGVSYNGDASIPPDSVVGQTLTWSSGTLGNVAPGTVLTFTANYTPGVSGTQSVASFSTSYADEFGESYSLDYCTSLLVQAGAIPSIDKSPSPQTVNPNDPVSWTITVSNAGALALDNPIVTDTLPEGFTFSSAIPAPTSVTPQPDGTTIVVWDFSVAPLGPLSIPQGGSTVITLNVIAPSAVTAAYTNRVTATGTDANQTIFNFSDTARVNVVNRPPIVDLTAPDGGELICGSFDITWTASDPDGDPLTFDLYYSDDGGATFPNLIASGVTSPYTWNTTALPSGTDYKVRVVASDGELSASDESVGSFTIDSNPPTVTLIDPNDGEILAGTVPLEATASDDIEVDRVEFDYFNGAIWVNISVDADPTGGWTDTWETDIIPEGDGVYPLRAVAFDTCGKSAIDEIEVTVDNTPPEVTKTPPSGSIVNGITPIEVTASDSECLDRVELYIDGVLVETVTDNGPSDDDLSDNEINFTFDWDTTAESDGLHTVIARAIDCAGNETDDENEYIVDNTPPEVTKTPPTGSLVTGITPIEVTASDSECLDRVEFYIDGVLVQTVIDNGPEDDDPDPNEINFTFDWDTTVIVDGDHVVIARAIDCAGNETDDRNVYTVDNTPPEVSKTPPSGSLVTGTTPIVVEASDGECLDRVELYIDGVLVRTVLDNGPGDDNAADNQIGFTFNWDTTAESDGLHTVIARAIDCVGNETDDENEYTVDNTPPEVTKTPPSGSLVTGTTPIEVTASDDICLDRVELYIDGVLVETVDDNGPDDDDLDDNEINFTFSWDTTLESDGLHIVIARAIDCVGNETDDENEYIVDNTPPEVTKTPPTGSLVTGITPIEVRAEDDICLDRAELYIDGVLVETVVDNGPSDDNPAGDIIEFTFNWNTNLETNGVHIVLARAIDCVGNQSDDHNEYIVDNTPPIVNIDNPADGDILNGTVPIDVSSSDNECLERVELYIDGVLVETEIVDPPGGTTADFSFDWNTEFETNGPHDIEAIAFDCAGNQATDQIQVIVDNEPPTVSIDDPPDGSIVNGTTPIDISAEDNECLERVELYIDGVLVDTEIVAPPGGTTADFTFDWDTTVETNGSHDIEAIAFDCAGNQATDQIELIVDNEPPEVEIVDPPDGSLVNGIIPIEVEASDNECLERVELYIDGVLVDTEIVTPPGGTTADFSFDWDTTAETNGTHDIEAIAFDCAGNQATDQIELIVDNVPPVVSIDDPPDGSIVEGLTPIDISASDDRCLERVELYIDGVLVFTQPVAPGTNVDFTFDWDTTVEADGPHNIEAVAIDCAGNEATDQIQLIVDNEPPEVSIDNPADGDLVTGTTPIDVSSSDNECLERVELYIDGVLVRTEIVTPPGGTTADFTFDWNTLAYSNGPHTITTIAFDCAGNQATDQIEVIVDNLPPEVEIVDPPDGSTVEGITPIEVTSSDNECLDRVELYIDGVLVTTEFVAPDTETTFFFDWDTTEYLEGPHTVTAIAFDCAGNQAVDESTLIVDNIPDNFVQTLVNGDLTIPEEKPDIEELIDANVEVIIDELFPFEAVEGIKIKVKGRVKIEIVYVADVEDGSQPVHTAHFEILFKALIKGIELGECVSLDPVVILEHQQFHKVDARTIKKAIVVLVGVRTVE